MIVLDSSALLTSILSEAGGDRMAPTLEAGTVLSAVNLAEILTVMLEKGVDPQAAQLALGGLSCEIVPFDQKLAIAAGLLRPRTRHLGLSLGDRACLALGMARGLPVLTADRSWTKLDLGVEIRLIR